MKTRNPSRQNTMNTRNVFRLNTRVPFY